MSTPRGSDLVTAGLALFAAGALAQGAMAVDTPFFERRDVSEVIGSGSKTCTLKPRADCRGVVDRWNIEHHGNLRKIRFTRANIVGADLRGADLRGADFRGGRFRYLDLRGARLDGAKFSSLPRRGKRANQSQGCAVGGCDVTVLTSIRAEGAALPMADMSCGQLYCAPGTGPLFENAQMGGTDLSGANLAGATTNQAVQVIYSVDTLNLQSANLTGANVVNANLAGATAINANMTGANLTGANLSWANLSGATLQAANATRTNFANAEFLYTNLNGVTWDATTCPSGTVSSTGC
ncbi:MAG: pentapeptide repeat-containing protein [Actinomycetota bacterium]